MKSESQIPYFISGGLLLSFIFSVAGSFFPPQSLEQTALFKIDAMFAIMAFSCLSAKLSSEKFLIPSAGFAVLAISQGMFLAEIDQADRWNYSSQVIGVLFMLPAVIMISYYNLIPKWLRITGVLAVVPFILLFIDRYLNGPAHTAVYENIIFLLYQIVTLCWAWQIWKNRKLSQ